MLAGAVVALAATRTRAALGQAVQEGTALKVFIGILAARTRTLILAAAAVAALVYMEKALQAPQEALIHALLLAAVADLEEEPGQRHQ